MVTSSCTHSSSITQEYLTKPPGVLLRAVWGPKPHNAKQRIRASLSLRAPVNSTQQFQRKWQHIRLLADAVMLLRLAGGRRGEVQHNVRPCGGRGCRNSCVARDAGGPQLRRWLGQVNHRWRLRAARTCAADQAGLACLAAAAGSFKTQGPRSFGNCLGMYAALQMLPPQTNLHSKRISFLAWLCGKTDWLAAHAWGTCLHNSKAAVLKRCVEHAAPMLESLQDLPWAGVHVAAARLSLTAPSCGVWGCVAAVSSAPFTSLCFLWKKALMGCEPAAACTHRCALFGDAHCNKHEECICKQQRIHTERLTSSLKGCRASYHSLDALLSH